MDFKTTHDLPFLSAYWDNPNNDEGWQVFNIGTCNGQWLATETEYKILTIINDQPGNGHLDDVFQWFENSCKRDGKALVVMEFFLNPGFKEHLISKRGFTPIEGTDNVIKKVFA